MKNLGEKIKFQRIEIGCSSRGFSYLSPAQQTIEIIAIPKSICSQYNRKLHSEIEWWKMSRAQHPNTDTPSMWNRVNWIPMCGLNQFMQSVCVRCIMFFICCSWRERCTHSCIVYKCTNSWASAWARLCAFVYCIHTSRHFNLDAFEHCSHSWRIF